MTISVSFDGFDLNSGDFRTRTYSPSGAPSRSIRLSDLARQDGAKQVFQKFEAQKLFVEGQISCISMSALDDAIDDLKSALRVESGVLEIGYGSGVRRWTCTAENIVINRGQENISFTPFSIEFSSESPFATDGTTDSYLVSQNCTDATKFFPFTVLGTYDIAPQITITVNSFSPTSDKTITLGNGDTSQFLDITATFTAGDIITVDCDTYRVFHNGTFIRSSGQFPSFKVGSQSLDYADDGTTRDIDVSLDAERRYL